MSLHRRASLELDLKLSMRKMAKIDEFGIENANV